VRFMVSDPKRFAQVISAQESIIDRGSGRGTLEGIAVYSVEGGIATVATNGAILVAYRFPADPIADPVADLSCIENWAMLSFIRSPSRGAISGALKPLCSGSFLPISFSEGTMTAAHGGATVAIGEISEYPDWRLTSMQSGMFQHRVSESIHSAWNQQCRLVFCFKRTDHLDRPKGSQFLRSADATDRAGVYRVRLGLVARYEAWLWSQKGWSQNKGGSMTIVVLHRGWIFIGDLDRQPDGKYRLTNAKNVRTWDKGGFGGLTAGAVSSGARLDPCADVSFDGDAMIFCSHLAENWMES